jgi:hypothetical protein
MKIWWRNTQDFWIVMGIIVIVYGVCWLVFG